MTPPSGPGLGPGIGLALALATTPLVAGAQPLVPDGPVTVSVIAQPPFAMRDEAGVHTGLAVDLFRLAAEAAGLEHRLVPAPGGAGAASLVGPGAIVLPVEADAALAGAADLSLPLYTATLGVASPRQSAILGVVEGLMSWSFLRVVLGIAAVLLVVGALIWLVERRRNADMFARGTARGLGDGFWWAGVTLTTIGYGDKTPVTALGRGIAMLWMLAGLALSVSLTATMVRLADIGGGAVDLSETLRDGRVAVVEDSLAGAFVRARAADALRVATPTEALDAVDAGRADLALGAAPAMTWARDEAGLDLAVRTTRWDPVLITMAFAPGDPLRETMDRALLEVLASEAGQAVVRRYVGDDG